jgi:hypothetical protein
MNSGDESPSLAIERLHRRRLELSPDEHSPDLDDLLAVLESLATAEKDLQQAAKGPKPSGSGWWGLHDADRNPHLFRVSNN